MSDEEHDQDDVDDASESEVIRNLRKQARGATEATKRAETAERKLAFLQAGVPDTIATGYFAKAYDGDLTPEAIREAAAEAGFITPDQEDDTGKEEREAQERIANASSGSDDSAPPGYEDELAKATSEAEVISIMEKYQQTVLHT